MPEATVKASFKNDPKSGAFYGSIKDDTLGYISVKREDMDKFQKGGTYKIEYAEVEKDGRIYKNLVKVLNGGQATMPPPKHATRDRTNPTDSERMWCCSILGAFIAAGKVDLVDLADANNVIRKAYANSFGGDDSRRDDGMGDHIPY